MKTKEAVKLLTEVEKKLFDLAMKVNMPSYAQDMHNEIRLEIKTVRIAIFKGLE